MKTNLILKKETMSSLEIAELTGKRHADVMRDIRTLLGKGIGESDFKLASYKDAKGEYRSLFYITKNGVSFLNQHYCNKDLANICGQKILVRATRFEVSFGNILVPVLKEMGLDVERQFIVGKFKIDFYIPKINVAIEYDEEQHNTGTNIMLDKQREDYIKSVLKCKFIRVSYENSDAKNVGKILNKIAKIR